MPVVQCLGLNHRTAPVGMREQLGYTNDDIPVALGRARHDPRIRHAVILSTCNRVEVYSSLPDGTDTRSLLTEFLATDRGLDASLIAPSLYYFEGLYAARHLCRVATGLDSLVLGESQILAQVTGALRRAASRRMVSSDLQRLFDVAVRAARRARSDAWGVIEPASISSVAVDHVRAVGGGNLSRAHVVVVGAGEVAGLAVRALRMQALGTLTIVNRGYERAVALAERGGGRAHDLSALPVVLQEADIVLVATGAPHFLVDAAMAASIMGARAGRPLIVGDIAVPRNVDPEVRHVSGIHLFDVDDVRPRLEHSLRALGQAVPAVEAIIETELETIAQATTL